jgi:hypothetical protein
LAAKSIAYSTGPSGVYLIELFERMGITAQIKAKVKQVKGEPAGAVVARGEAELGFQQMSELLDMPGMTEWVKAFVHKARLQPKYWGLHNYLDANYLRTSGTRALLRATTGEIWFTETGGIVKRRNGSKVRGFTESATHAAIATRWVFNKLAALSPRRITHIYLFHWNPSTTHDSWDSGLVNIHDQPRPAYRVLKKFLAALARRSA